MFILLGIASFCYYFMIVRCVGRWTTTFAWFWLLLGGVFLFLGSAMRLLPQAAQNVIWLFACIGFCFFAVTEYRIVAAMTKRPPADLDYLIVLGAQVRGRRITDSLRRRLEKAVVYAQEYPATKVIVSGGQGKGEEISEAEAMKEYLISCQIAEDRILCENRSTTTFENLVFSSRIIGDYSDRRVGIVTNNFHIYRAVKIAGEAGFRNVSALPASTKRVVLPNYMVRECFAEMKRILRTLKSRR